MEGYTINTGGINTGVFVDTSKRTITNILRNDGDFATYIGNKKRCWFLRKTIEYGDILCKVPDGITLIEKVLL